MKLPKDRKPASKIVELPKTQKIAGRIIKLSSYSNPTSRIVDLPNDLKNNIGVHEFISGYCRGHFIRYGRWSKVRILAGVLQDAAECSVSDTASRIGYYLIKRRPWEMPDNRINNNALNK